MRQLLTSMLEILDFVRIRGTTLQWHLAVAAAFNHMISETQGVCKALRETALRRAEMLSFAHMMSEMQGVRKALREAALCEAQLSFARLVSPVVGVCKALGGARW